MSTDRRYPVVFYKAGLLAIFLSLLLSCDMSSTKPTNLLVSSPLPTWYPTTSGAVFTAVVGGRRGIFAWDPLAVTQLSTPSEEVVVAIWGTEYPAYVRRDGTRYDVVMLDGAGSRDMIKLGVNPIRQAVWLGGKWFVCVEASAMLPEATTMLVAYRSESSKRKELAKGPLLSIVSGRASEIHFSELDFNKDEIVVSALDEALAVTERFRIPAKDRILSALAPNSQRMLLTRRDLRSRLQQLVVYEPQNGGERIAYSTAGELSSISFSESENELYFLESDLDGKSARVHSIDLSTFKASELFSVSDWLDAARGGEQ